MQRGLLINIQRATRFLMLRCYNTFLSSELQFQFVARGALISLVFPPLHIRHKASICMSIGSMQRNIARKQSYHYLMEARSGTAVHIVRQTLVWGRQKDHIAAVNS